jgi:hypothetical protein
MPSKVATRFALHQKLSFTYFLFKSARAQKEWRIQEDAKMANLFLDASSILFSEERSEKKEQRKRFSLLHSSWAAFSPFQVALGHNNQPKSQKTFSSLFHLILSLIAI